MKIGEFNLLEVVRESDIAYILTDGKEEIFLHKKEAERAYLPKERIQVFIYVDNLGRPTASTKTPLVTTETATFLEVVSVNPKYGVFLDYGLVKDLLLSKDDLPFELDAWPRVGEKMFASLREKKGHLFARMVGRKQITHYFSADRKELEPGSTVEATVLFLIDDGLVCFTDQGDEIFIHINNTRERHHLGEAVEPRILKRNPSLEYSGSLIGLKETMISADGDTILSYLKNHGGEMRFTDKSSPEDIMYAFKMSKAAYKRALGGLYRQGLVELTQDRTILKNPKK